MKLSSAASHFNNTICTDAYTGQYLFAGQFALFDDTKRDSEPGGRRVLSLDPLYTPPLRRVIEAQGARYILGDASPDSFRGSVIRVGYVAHEAIDNAHVRTLAQASLGQQGVTMYVGRTWVKNMAYTDQDSKLAQQIHVHAASSEAAIEPLRLVTVGTAHYLIRQVTVGTTGLAVAQCDEMPGPVLESAQVISGTYDPITDSVQGVSTGVGVVRVRWQSLFEYTYDGTATFGAGDAQFVIAKAAMTVRPGAQVTLSDGPWKIASAQSHGDVWLCRGVRSGQA